MISSNEWRRSLNNQNPHRGVALVSVLGEGAFAMAHMPGSIHIPHGTEDVFERCFAKDKEIIVYCVSPDCPASDNVAAAPGDSRLSKGV